MSFGSASTTVSGAFGDFFFTTTKRTLSSASMFVNEAASRNYLLRRLMKGKDGSRVFQNGSAIQDFVIFSAGSTRQRYDPNSEAAPSNPQVLTPWSIPWTFTLDNMTWTDHEILLQAGGRDSDGQFAVFKRLADAKRARLMTSMANGTEADFFAVPDTTKMEATGGVNPQEPYALVAHLNEYSTVVFTYTASGQPTGLGPNMLFGGTVTTGGVAPSGVAWTTKQGISPVTQPLWRGAFASYADDPNLLGAGEPYDLFQAFDQATARTQFESMPLGEQYAPSDPGPMLIITSTQGRVNYMTGSRIANNLFRYGAQDPAYPSPVNDGRALLAIQALDTAPIYPNGNPSTNAHTALVAENDATCWGIPLAGGAPSAPRYYGVNLEYLAMVWHSERYFEPSETVSPYKQPYTHTRYYDTWSNLAVRSLRHHFHIAPGVANLT